MEIEDLINKLVQSTAAQKEANCLQRESNQHWRQELGLPTREPEVSELKWVLVWPAPQQLSAVDQESLGAEQGSSLVEQESLATELELLLSATDKGEEVRIPLPPQPRPPPLRSSPVLLGVVPCPKLLDTLPECPDLPVLDLVPRSVHHHAQSVPWSPTPLPLKLQMSRRNRLTSHTFPRPLTVFTLENQTSLCRS
ncbi:UNVERIFIED_CONTAM: hypothetical protein FKN15_010399 [Acipenser sinensis]